MWLFKMYSLSSRLFLLFFVLYFLNQFYHEASKFCKEGERKKKEGKEGGRKETGRNGRRERKGGREDLCGLILILWINLKILDFAAVINLPLHGQIWYRFSFIYLLYNCSIFSRVPCWLNALRISCPGCGVGPTPGYIHMLGAIRPPQKKSC